MAWGKNRHRTSASTSDSCPSSATDRSSSRQTPSELTDNDIARRVQQSRVRVRVALGLTSQENDEKSWRDLLTTFETNFCALRSRAVTSSHQVHVELLECGLNTWQDLVALQRLLMKITRPIERGEEALLAAKTMVRPGHTNTCNEWTLCLKFATQSEETLRKFASSLGLKLKSLGILPIVLLRMHGMVVSLLSAVAAPNEASVDKYQWKGKHVANQLVLQVCHDENVAIQRIFWPPVHSVTRPDGPSPELVSIVDTLLRCESQTQKPVVVILRGIPGSGKSWLKQELESLCQARGINFTACSADAFFETSRGYVFKASKLNKAHKSCKKTFTKALYQTPRDPVHKHIVLVDNTHTRRWEYEAYEALATANGSMFAMIEIKCTDVWMALRMGQRNAHGVPVDKVLGMFMQWQPDARAHCFPPHVEAQQLAANPLSNGAFGTVTYVGLFLDETAQQKLLARLSLAHARHFADHVTLSYQPNALYTRQIELGASFIVYGVEIVLDDKAQALCVRLEDEQLLGLVRDQMLHITLSTTDDVTASYANHLVAGKSAKRVTLDPPIELTTSLGAALRTPNQRVIIKESPFADNGPSCPKQARELTRSECTHAMPAYAPSKVFALYVDASDLVRDIDDVTASLLWRIQIMQHKGAACQIHRLLCIQRSRASLSTPDAAILQGLQARLDGASALQFHDWIVLSHPPSFPKLEMAIKESGRKAGVKALSDFTLITSVKEAMLWPVSSIALLCTATISLIYSGLEASVIPSLSAYDTNLSTLDLLGITTQEEICSRTNRGIKILNEAWALVYEANSPHAVQRIDSTLVGLSASVVELFVALPSRTAPSEADKLQTRLVCALEDRQGVHVLRSRLADQIYFSLCTASSETPVFSVRLERQPGDGDHGATKARLQSHCCQRQCERNRGMGEREAYSVLVGLVRAIITQHCGTELPSECRLSSLIHLTSERLVEHYLIERHGVEGMPAADDVESGRILLTLSNMLHYLLELDAEDWAAAVGDALLALQGHEQAQAVWKKAMETAMQSCAAVLASSRCGIDTLMHTPLSNPTHFFQVLKALLTTSSTVAARTSLKQTCVNVRPHSMCSHLHSLALCDELQVAAAMVLPHVDDELHSNRFNLFVCTTSVVTHRVNVTTSSLDLLRHVVEHFQAKTVFGHDCELRIGE